MYRKDLELQAASQSIDVTLTGVRGKKSWWDRLSAFPFVELSVTVSVNHFYSLLLHH